MPGVSYVREESGDARLWAEVITAMCKPAKENLRSEPISRRGCHGFHERFSASRAQSCTNCGANPAPIAERTQILRGSCPRIGAHPAPGVPGNAVQHPATGCYGLREFSASLAPPASPHRNWLCSSDFRRRARHALHAAQNPGAHPAPGVPGNAVQHPATECYGLREFSASPIPPASLPPPPRSWLCSSNFPRRARPALRAAPAKSQSCENFRR
jgi:hypothetical protein